MRSTNDDHENECTIWDLVIKNNTKMKKKKKKKNLVSEYCDNNDLSERSKEKNETDPNLITLNYEKNLNEEDNKDANKGIEDPINNILCNISEQGKNDNLNKEQEIEDEGGIDKYDKNNLDNVSDEENNCDDFLSLLNVCSSNFSNKLNINDNGDVIYDDKRRHNSTNLLNENSNNDNLSLIMQKKNKINQNLNNCQIEKYKDAYKKTKLCKWSNEETKKFYQAIEMFGVDLMMVRALIPKFSDKQIRDKYKREKKINPFKIEEAIKKNKEINLDAYENEHGKIDNSTHYKYYQSSSSDTDNNNTKKTPIANESEINILNIFDNQTNNDNNDSTFNQENSDFNILTLF